MTPTNSIHTTYCRLYYYYHLQEEYHTHVLPHCAGKWCGTTEVNYALGLNALIMGFIDRTAFFGRPLNVVMKPLGESITQHIPDALGHMELRYFMISGWIVMSTILMSLSIRRVVTHPRVQSKFNAMSKLLTPVALCLAAFIVPPAAVRTRYLSVTLGLSFSILTKKMIVFSMAKMPFAAVQWDAIPLLLTTIWIRFDNNLTKMGGDFVLGALCFYYTWRLLHWANVTIDQICKKLDINCFTIKKKKTD
jgi:hypothetical protein